MSADALELDDFAAAYLKRYGAMAGKQLYEALALKFPYLTEDKFADLVQRLATGGQIDVYDENTGSFWSYLVAWEKSLWFYVSIVASVSAVLTAYLIPSNSPFIALRLGLGLVFVLYLPGYVALEALYPASELGGLDRVALSIGVSLVLDMLSGLALNYTPWGIRLVPILLLLGALTVCLAVLGLIRRFEASRGGRQRS
jgi:uncharacterized membrane protein